MKVLRGLKVEIYNNSQEINQMIRYFVFLGILVCALVFITNLSSTDVGEVNQASAFGGVAMLSEGVSELREPGGGESPFVHFDKAFDLKEGAAVMFSGLSIMFKGIELDHACGEDICRAVTVAVSKGGSSEDVIIEEGNTASWNGYTIKVSQTAPLENKNNVPYRAVLLVSDTNE